MKHRATQAVLPLLLVTAALAGCDGENPAADTTGNQTSTDTTTAAAGGGGAGGTDTTDGGGGSGGSGGTTQPEPVKRKTLSGDVTWQVTFDAQAQAAGATNCSYTRHYEAVEDRSAQWLCPECEIMFQADVDLTAGLTDCYPQVSNQMVNAKEWLGYGNGTWWRSAAGPMSAQGTATVEGTAVSTFNQAQDVPAVAGGTLGFDVTGQLTLGEEEGDPWNGFVPPATYACGWPKANPPEYTGDYVLVNGGVVPDGFFKDACDETVRLHDFKGSYLVIEMSAMDCPPCQTMASQEEEFVASMAAQGISVHVITLLCPSLGNVLGKTTKAQLKNWINSFELKSPVLADRGWGLSIFEPAIGSDQIGYPSLTIVSPDLEVLDFYTGFADFSDVEAVILADQKP